MVIECSQCHTRFRLADEKVKPGGTKVRCSKCKNVFKVLPPQPEPEPEPAFTPQPEVSGGGEELDFGDFNMERLPDEEEETGFGPPFETERADSSDFTTATDQSLSEEEGAFSFGFEDSAAHQENFPSEGEDFSFTDKPENALSEEHTYQEGATGEGEPTFGEGDGSDDFEFNVEGETNPSTEFSFGDEETPGGFSFEEDESAEFSFEDEEPVGDYSFDETEEPLGAGEEPSWGEEVPFSPETSVTAGATDLDFGGMSFGEGNAGAASSGKGQEAPYPEPGSPSPPSEPRMAETGPGRESAAPKRVLPPPVKRRRSPFRGVLIFIILLLLALCGIAAYFYLHGGVPNLMQLADRIVSAGQPSASQGQIRVVGLSGSFATNKEAGQLFVIRGKAVNGYPDARSAIAVKGIIYNKAGKPLLQQTVFAGNPLDEQSLGNLPFAKIEESMHNQFGDSLSNLNIAPGKSIPFTIVFRELPPDLAEFAVEVVDSKSGTKQ
jgi:predicted Zn finger-like uncharacterized protein